jgi:peptidoglycan/xylan/chitin deacetylase (PgdA/CDA1 family)
MRLRFSILVVGFCAASALLVAQGRDEATDITQWQDGKRAALAITYDDSTINQFRIGLPLMNERGLVGTFFVITSQIPGSSNMPTFVGRPIMDIVRESATVPTSPANVYERTSMLRYLSVIQRAEELAGARIQPGNLASVDAALEKLRATGKTYTVGAVPYELVRSEESTRPPANQPGGLTWDEFRRAAAQGHELANHTVSHARLSDLDDANMSYETDKARDDLRTRMGEKHTYSIEAPFGIRDEKVRQALTRRFELTRNWVSDADGVFMEGIMRGNNKDVGTSARPYVLWERGPVSNTTLEQMTGWIDKSLQHGTWLVLVIHGIEGIGYEPIPKDRVAAYFDYMKAKSDQMWIATYQDGSKYMRERMGSTVTTRRASDGGLVVTVKHSLDPKVYDLPLTARTTVPAAWTNVRVRQGSTTQTVAAKKEGDRTFVQYRVVADGSAVAINEAR